MAATITSQYMGNLQINSQHVPSNTTLISDAPTDNGGKGQSFSPTDLCALSLGTCAMTMMGLYAQSHDLDMTGATMETVKIMGTQPRRIAEIQVTITMPPKGFSDKDKKSMENAVKTCPVHHSLHPSVVQNISIIW